jgi:predicted  nucleic acid-binding Zn-ribbon protein
VELEALRSQLSSAQRASQQLERELQELQLALEQQKAATAASQVALSEARESAAAAAAAAEEQAMTAEQVDASMAELRSHYEGERLHHGCRMPSHTMQVAA